MRCGRGRFLKNKKGAVLFVVLLFSLLIASIMAYIAHMVYQRTRLLDAVGVKRTRNYYRAQAGLVDAYWRLRTNHAPPGLPGNFNDANFSVQYYMSIDSGTITPAREADSTVMVTIGTRNDNIASADYHLRPVSATGLDT